jgi:ribosomal protein S18 acetylase RimI-like enzyme
MSEPHAIDVRPLTPKRFPDLASLFEEGGDPKWCWCTYFRVRGRDWSNSTRAGNRAELGMLAERADIAPGLIGYRDSRAVGWVSLGPRDGFDRIVHSKVIPKIDERPVWSIVCFAVSASARERGIGRALLDAAVAFARNAGAEAVEAYPIDLAAGETIPAESAFGGTVSMFRKAGFEVVAERASDPSKVHPRVVVRRELSGPI